MRFFNFILIYTAAFFIFFDFNSLSCMKKEKEAEDAVAVDVEMGVPTEHATQDHDITPVRVTVDKKAESVGVMVDLGREKFNTFRLQQYYHPETKTLDLSHKPMGDQGLRAIFDHIRHFISENDTEILLLESMNLVEVPYYLITFALVDKHLRVVSFQNNRFNIPGLPVLEDGAAAAASTTGTFRHSVNMGKRESKRASIPVFQSGQDASGPRLAGNAGTVVQMVTTLWESFSPEIARELEAQNLSSEVIPLFKKIIFIDKRIPPITVFDQTQTVVSQPSKCQKFKYVVERALYTIAGGVVAILPQIITLFTNSSSSDKCDQDMLEKMIMACNSSTTFRGDFNTSGSDVQDKDKDLKVKVAETCKVDVA